jgi:hypothetical protein
MYVLTYSYIHIIWNYNSLSLQNETIYFILRKGPITCW